jgi:hypothetical protein
MSGSKSFPLPDTGLESEPMSQAAAEAIDDAGSNTSPVGPPAVPAYWQLLDSWTERIKVAATLDRETLMGLYLAVDGGYVPTAWVEKHYPSVAKQWIAAPSNGHGTST